MFSLIAVSLISLFIGAALFFYLSTRKDLEDYEIVNMKELNEMIEDFLKVIHLDDDNKEKTDSQKYIDLKNNSIIFYNQLSSFIKKDFDHECDKIVQDKLKDLLNKK